MAFPLRVWAFSDLHFEGIPYPDAFRPLPDFDVLACAGDVWEADVGRAVSTVATLARGKPAVMVLGNHEHWRGCPEGTVARARAACRAAGVHLLERDEILVMGVRFAGATLWTDTRLGAVPRSFARGDGTVGYADTAKLPHEPFGEPILAVPGGGPVTSGAMVARHAADAAWIEALRSGTDVVPLVVVTHHPPVVEAVDPRSGRPAFEASDLGWLVDRSGAALWLHGHVHRSLDLVRPSGTRLLCNPAGPRLHNPGFDDSLVALVRRTR